MSSLYFHKSRRPSDDPVKRARAVWKLRALKFSMAVAMNLFTTWRSFLKLFCRYVVQPKHRMFRITRWRSSGVPFEKIRTIMNMYQRLKETCPRKEAIGHDIEQLMNALRQLFPLVSVRCWYIMLKAFSCCSNLLDRNSAWSPSRNNSKLALLWLNNNKMVSKNSSTLWRNS